MYLYQKNKNRQNVDSNGEQIAGGVVLYFKKLTAHFFRPGADACWLWKPREPPEPPWPPEILPPVTIFELWGKFAALKVADTP